MLSIPFGQAPFAFALAEQLFAALLVATLLIVCPINSIDAELSAFALMCIPGLAVPGTAPLLITIEPGRLGNIVPKDQPPPPPRMEQLSNSTVSGYLLYAPFAQPCFACHAQVSSPFLPS